MVRTAGLASATLPLLCKGQTKPCTPPTLAASGGTSANTDCSTASAAAESDWTARSTGPGVVWFHDFREQAEVDNFRWTNGYGSGNDPLAKGASNVQWIQGGGIVSGSGYLQIYHGADGNDGHHWWRPLAPLTGSGNGRGADDPAAGSSLAVRAFSPTDGGGQTAAFPYGWYAHPADQSGDYYDGQEFYVQIRQQRDQRRLTDSFGPGKLNWFSICDHSYSNQELVTYSGAPYNGGCAWRAYGAWRLDYPLDEEPGTSDGTIQAGGVTPIWTWSGGIDTVMYHFIVGRAGVRETLIETYAAHEGETSYTLIQSQTIPVGSWDPKYEGGGKGWQALILSQYNNGHVFSHPWWDRWYQLIFSHSFIPCPQA